ncbi:MAG TPA: hypothetical protein PK325_05895 [Cyclobacteriaceae bacterium]|nr:hypothetical protein [Cyclobacteriaceae bacterium]HMV09837.1 hypothetical protein [Cyclobacteriaceae bacterium]HMV89559.1 hypothetical protein [Cyclobacteriaceae bacterium]HMX00454.1 hypothetical protein [Cyclobacteriaceae bacterium]HMX50462.1 hypothetical protein [Cyclobacteriaceae bacterium]
MTPSKEELVALYQKLPDHKLMDILYNSGEYRPEALEAATEELKQRKISTEFTTGYIEEKKDKEVRYAENADVPLPLHLKMLFFFAWFIPVFFGGAYRLNYQEDGMLKKLWQSWLYSIAGIGTVVITVILSLAFKLSNIATISIMIGLFCIFYGLETRYEGLKK